MIAAAAAAAAAAAICLLVLFLVFLLLHLFSRFASPPQYFHTSAPMHDHSQFRVQFTMSSG